MNAAVFSLALKFFYSDASQRVLEFIRETRRIFAVESTKDYFMALGIPVEHGRGMLPRDPDDFAVPRRHHACRSGRASAIDPARCLRAE